MVTRFVLALLFSVSCFQTTVHAQDFEGVITYEITYESKTEGSNPMAAMMLPSKEILTIKGQQSKVTQESNMTTNTFIKLPQKDTTLVYFEAMGQKIQLLLSSAEITDRYTPFKALNVEKTSGKQLINNSLCKRALVSFSDSLPPIEVYYLPNSYNAYPMFGSLEGIPVSYTMETPQYIITKTAVNIEPKNIPPTAFAPLNGFTPKTVAELQAMFGGFGAK